MCRVLPARLYQLHAQGVPLYQQIKDNQPKSLINAQTGQVQISSLRSTVGINVVSVSYLRMR
jgi:hypothetical protein